MMNDTELLAALRAETNVHVGDDAHLSRALNTAKTYVAQAIGAATVPDTVLADCIISCAADLYNTSSARLGVMDVGDADTLQPYRVSTDPLRAVWPKLQAAGVLTGGMVIS